MKMINIVHLGLGPIGQKIVKFALEGGCFCAMSSVKVSSS